MSTRMTSARFVGRSAQLAELEAALRDAGHGRPSLALIAGDSGVGKSRLVEELSRRARESGARVLSGDSVELGDGELPYAPLLGALRPLVRAGDPSLDALSPPLRSALASILPGLEEQGGSDGSAAAQSHVFEALLALLEELGEESPVVLVIEDLHWADSSTRSFLGFLVRALCGERLLVVATYRPDELHRRHPLRPLLAELTRDPSSRLLELPAFTREELAEQLEGILAGPPDPGLAERVYARSEGNALFTEEILAAGLDGRGTLPPTLRDALMLRVERLPARAQELLRWLACQPAVDHELLAVASGVEPGELRDGLREAVASQIAVALPDGSYAFRHALLREVVHDDLLPGERAEMHAVLARALDARCATNERAGAHLSAQVAQHWFAAGDQPAALAAAVQAATAAEQVNAYGESHALLERALALWDRVPDPERLAQTDRVSVLARAANAADVAGDSVRQEALLQRALELVDPEREPRRVAALLERLQRAQWDLNRQNESVETLDRALALIEPGEDSRERAALLAAKARARMLQGRQADAIEAGQEALAVARATGDFTVETSALNSIGHALYLRGDLEGGLAALREALEIAREHRLASELQRSHLNLADTLHLSGRSDEALEVARRGLKEGHDEGRACDWLEFFVAEVQFDLGHWEAARRAMPSERRRHVGTTLLLRRLLRATQLLGRGDDELARPELDAASRAARDSMEPQFLALLGALRAELERRAGDVPAARAAVDEALDRIEFCSDDLARIAQVAGAGVRVEADAAQLARDRRDGDAEQEARGRAASMSERVRLAGERGGPIAAAQIAMAEAERARADGNDDPAL
jgi:tetratricopeptide (TPR) repeat protein